MCFTAHTLYPDGFFFPLSPAGLVRHRARCTHLPQGLCCDIRYVFDAKASFEARSSRDCEMPQSRNDA